MEEPKIINFGCRLNACESDVIRRIACEFGMTGYIIINTCAVTSEAERQVKQCIRKVHRENPNHGIILTGCASTYDPDTYAKMDGVVAVIDNKSKLLRHAYQKYATPNTIAVPPNKNVRHFVQIQNGCDNFCTYCIVRITRGTSVSFSKEQVLDNIRNIISDHPDTPCEIVLTGVNISSYKHDIGNLADLVRYLLKNEQRLKRLRLSSMDPADIDGNFIDMFASDSRIMPHLHLSIQSGDDLILARMRRRHTRGYVQEITDKILQKRPNTIFGADFITGFPTETEEMFDNTRRLIEEANISLAHVFPYSERQGTPAALMPQVQKSVRKSRANKLIHIANNALNDKLLSLVGATVSVLAETENSGKTDNFLSVKTSDKMQYGCVYDMRVIAVNDGNLITVMV